MSLRHFLKHTALGRFLLIPYRFVLQGLPHLGRQFALTLRWALLSREHYNHTYHLTDLNRTYLTSFVAVITARPLAEIERYVRELQEDEHLESCLRQRTLSNPDRYNADAEPRYGRRLGWYALVRATKPRVIIETGVDRGLGTAVLAAALLRNAKEGCPGLVYATDINPACGYLLAAPYSEYARLLLGDSVELLKSFSQPVDIFLHDSDHRAEYEWAELLAIEPRLHERSLVLSDNSNQTSKLLEFAERTGRHFLYFQDQPKNHWWPGDGIGVSFTLGAKIAFQAGPAPAPVPK